MEPAFGGSVASTQRLRDAIARQVSLFLENGGKITVVDTPKPERPHKREARFEGQDLRLVRES